MFTRYDPRRAGRGVIRVALAAMFGVAVSAADFPSSNWWQDAGDKPLLSLRAELMMLPLYGGIPLYGDMWSGHEPNDRSARNAFHDQAAWEERFQRLERLRLNALVLAHPHPYVLFVDYRDQYPEAAWLKPPELAAKRQMLRWLIDAGRRHGISLYFLTWNVWLPRGFASSRGVNQEGVDTPLTREFTRWSVGEFFRAYPGFGGLATMAAESPPGCADFVREGIVEGMRQATPRPRLILWNWCSYPEQVRQVLAAYDGESQVMDYLQYEQFFSRRADPRIGMFSRDLGGWPMTALGGPKSANAYLLFANPGFAHDVVNDFWSNCHGKGLVIEEVHQRDRWLAEAAFARYAWNPREPYRAEVWEALLAERYGGATLAKPLLAALENASLVIPTQLKLTHSQTDHFMPQTGLLLAQILAMPSLSTYVFENSQQTDERGYLKPNLGICRPNPDWGESVTPIRQWVIGLIPEAGTRAKRMTEWMDEQRRLGFQPQQPQPSFSTPPQVVEELARIVRAAEQALRQAEAERGTAQQRQDELAHLFEMARLNLALGHYFLLKDRAAIACERFAVLGTKADAETCEGMLRGSLEAWKDYAVLGDRIHSSGIWYWQSLASFPPPWSQNDLWNSYAHRHSTFADLTLLWEKEFELLRERLAAARASGQPVALPLMDELRPRKRGGEAIAQIDFEEESDARYTLPEKEAPKVELTRDPALVISGRRSLLADSRGINREWHLFFEVNPEQVRLQPKTRYQVCVRYRVIAADGPYAAPFAMALRTRKGGWRQDVGDSRTWGQKAGSVSERILLAETKDFDDYYLLFSLHGPAAIAIDNILIEKLP